MSLGRHLVGPRLGHRRARAGPGRHRPPARRPALPPAPPRRLAGARGRPRPTSCWSATCTPTTATCPRWPGSAPTCRSWCRGAARTCCPGSAASGWCRPSRATCSSVAGARIEVLGATHDGRRLPLTRRAAPALGFRVTAGGTVAVVPRRHRAARRHGRRRPVDLALPPDRRLGPHPRRGPHGARGRRRAPSPASAPRCTLPVHWGTFWPAGLSPAGPRQPPPALHHARGPLRRSRWPTRPSTGRSSPAHGERVAQVTGQ